MDFGIVARRASRRRPGRPLRSGLAVPLRSAVAAIVGGLLLGYGARLAYGCNIGAYFSGIASGSLHGWVWLVAAFFGNVARHARCARSSASRWSASKLTGC